MKIPIFMKRGIPLNPPLLKGVWGILLVIGHFSLVIDSSVFAGESQFSRWLVQQEKGIEDTVDFPPEMIEETPPESLLSETKTEKKGSIPRAILYSLILPGTGQLYLGSKGTGKGFLIAEGVIWAGFGGFSLYGRQVREDYRLYASSVAGAKGWGDFDERYYDAMEFNLSSEEYNATIREEARNLFPDDPQQQEEYVRERIYSGESAWSWPSADALREYKRLRSSSRSAFQKATYALGLAIVNRVVSALNILRFDEKAEGVGLEINHDLEKNSWQVGLTLRRKSSF